MPQQKSAYGERKRTIDHALVVQLAARRDKELLVRDGATDGFFLKVAASGRVSFGVAYCFHGQERRMTLGSFPELTVVAARRLAKRARAEALTGSDPLAMRAKARKESREFKQAPDLRYLREHYFKTKIRATRPDGGAIRSSHSIKDEERYWRDILEHGGETTKLTELTSQKVEAIHRAISKRAPVAANRAHGSLRSALGIAVKAGWIKENPAVGITRNEEAPRERYLSNDEIARLRLVVERYQDDVSAQVVWFALLTGARRGEILNARWVDIDLKVGVWVKPRATTKQRRLHRLPLSSEALITLKKIRSLAPSIDLVLPGNQESTLTRLKRSWVRMRCEAQLADVHFHDLRHAHASILVSQGYSLAIVGAALGHSQAQTTLRYAHLMDSTLREAASRVATIANDAGSACEDGD
jgi:integrase